MSVDIKDFRRFVEGKAEEAPVRPAPLLQQADSALATTGDDYLDKLIRVLEAKVVSLEAEAASIAAKAVGCVPEEMFRLAQCEYMYVKGKVDGYKDAAQIPARIIAESRPTAA